VPVPMFVRYVIVFTSIIVFYLLMSPADIPRFSFYSSAEPTFEYQKNAYGDEALELNFNILEKINDFRTADGGDIISYPEEILFFDGKRVRIKGHFLLPMMASRRDPCSEFGVAQYGIGCSCCTGTPPPSPFNTIIVKASEGKELEPIFSPYIEVTGIFRCQKEYYHFGDRKELAAIFFIEGEEYRKIEPKLWQKILGVK
jgi:hypothetical protein